MKATVWPSVIAGTIAVPPGKSAMQRACALALLHKGKTTIHNPGISNDDLAAISIIKAFGAEVNAGKGSLTVSSKGFINACNEINCEESGLSLRMFAPIAALGSSPVLLTGEGSLLTRPMHLMHEIFPLLDIRVNSDNGFLPVTITGPLKPKSISIDGSQSSQYLTGLLFALAKCANEQVILHVKNLKSKPYIYLSLRMLKHFGYNVFHEHYKIFYINPMKQSEREIHYINEGDWSSASFMMVAAALSGSVILKGLQVDSAQADKSITKVLESCGADLVSKNEHISVTNKNPLRSFSFDATDCPDLFPPLTALAAGCVGTSSIKGVSRLAGKESNRAEALSAVFTRMGVKIFLRDDYMIIEGKQVINSALVSSHHDHRIAMACAVAALNAAGPVIIDHAEAVNKSYPDFYNHLKLLGASVSLSED